MKSDVTSKNKISKKREDMSRLDELIKELCPNGVEYKELGEIVKSQRGKTITKELIKDGDIPVISGGQKPPYYHNESNRKGEVITIAGSGAYAGFVMYWDKPIFVSDAFSIECDKSYLNIKYIYYFLQNNQMKIYSLKKGGGVPHVYFKDMQKFLVPVPPLEVQNEIVRILDNFTALTAELTAELTARKRQYSWYRDYLLKFENKIKIMKLEDLFELKNGYTPSKSNSEYWENGDVNWFKIEDINSNGRVLSNSLEKVNKKGIKGKLFPENALIISTSATIGEYALITKEFLCNQRFTCLITKEEYKELILPMFLKHYAYILSKKCKENIKIGNFPSVDMDKFKKFSIALPPLEVQKRIVEVLDNFEKICNDLNIGLPAEIEARQKQYEFYRNYLLTFNNEEIYALSKQASPKSN